MAYRYIRYDTTKILMSNSQRQLSRNSIPNAVKMLWSSKNNDQPESYTSGSGKVKYWEGQDCKHTWKRSIREQVKYNNCPYCSGSKVLAGFNDLATTHPQIAHDWDYEKNNDSPTAYTSGSHKSKYWKCSLGHSYVMEIQKRTLRGNGCPYCANRKVLSGFNDLASQYPDLKETYSPHNPIPSNLLVATSHKKVEWVCEHGHSWVTEVRKRTIGGQGCPVCSGNMVSKGFNDAGTYSPHLLSEWSENNSGNLYDYTYGSEHSAKWVCEHGHEWKTNINARTLRGSGCPVCATTKTRSKAEQEILEYVLSLGKTALANDRTILSPYEVDVYIPEYKIGIEFNGIYWHNEDHIHNHLYHRDKWKLAEDKGIQLLQIWEDEWTFKKTIVKNMIAHKLHQNCQGTVYARNTNIEHVTYPIATQFLNTYHIQGSVTGSYYVALKEKSKNAIVALMVLKKEAEGRFNLLRYATSMNVPGGFSKLLSYVGRTFHPISIVTFSDNCVSDGGLYRDQEFVKDKEIRPDYMYVIGGCRKHKFGFRLKRFKNDPTLTYIEGLSESQLAKLNHIPRIWDAGKTKWVKYIL